MVYIDFYQRLVEAVSDEHTCQSLLNQLSSSALISDKKIAQLSSSKITGNSLLKTLGLEEELHLLVPLVNAMSRVEQMQTLAEKMFAVLNQGAKKLRKIFYRNQKDVGMKKSTTGPQCKPTIKEITRNGKTLDWLIDHASLHQWLQCCTGYRP